MQVMTLSFFINNNNDINAVDVRDKMGGIRRNSWCIVWQSGSKYRFAGSKSVGFNKIICGVKKKFAIAGQFTIAYK